MGPGAQSIKIQELNLKSHKTQFNPITFIQPQDQLEEVSNTNDYGIHQETMYCTVRTVDSESEL